MRSLHLKGWRIREAWCFWIWGRDRMESRQAKEICEKNSDLLILKACDSLPSCGPNSAKCESGAISPSQLLWGFVFSLHENIKKFYQLKVVLGSGQNKGGNLISINPLCPHSVPHQQWCTPWRICYLGWIYTNTFYPWESIVDIRLTVHWKSLGKCLLALMFLSSSLFKHLTIGYLEEGGLSWLTVFRGTVYCVRNRVTSRCLFGIGSREGAGNMAGELISRLETEHLHPHTHLSTWQIHCWPTAPLYFKLP